MQMSVAGFSGCYNFCIVDVDHESNVSMLKMTHCEASVLCQQTNGRNAKKVAVVK